MKCNHSYQNISLDLSSQEFEDHLKECAKCTDLYSKVNDTMAVLDQDFDVPEGMIDAILERKRQVQQIKVRDWNMSGYLQLAAAILFGVFIGHVFGRDAKISPMLKKNQDPLTEYYYFHHLNVDHSEFDINSL